MPWLLCVVYCVSSWPHYYHDADWGYLWLVPWWRWWQNLGRVGVEGQWGQGAIQGTARATLILQPRLPGAPWVAGLVCMVVGEGAWRTDAGRDMHGPDWLRQDSALPLPIKYPATSHSSTLGPELFSKVPQLPGRQVGGRGARQHSHVFCLAIPSTHT